jgi:hypothetical protein
MREVLAFDPFTVLKPPAQEGAEGAEEGKAGDEDPKPPKVEGASPDPEAKPPAPPPEAAKGEEDEGARLREAVAKLLGTQPAKPEAQPPAQPPAKPEAPPKAPAEGEFQGYNFQVPDEVIGAIGSDDPAVVRKGVNALVNGLANKLAKDFGGMMAEAAQAIQAKAVEAALGQVNAKTQEQQVREDFYGNFKDLKEVRDRLPAFDNLVWQTATQLAQTSGLKSGWTPEFRDQLGSVLRLQLGLASPNGAPAKPPGAKPTPRKPSFSAGGAPSPRPAEAGGNDFMSVLNAGH